MDDVTALNARPTKAIINLSRLIANLRALESKIPNGQESLPVIKANGYGLGAVPVAQALVSYGVNRVGVATFEEALSLRTAGIACDIFVLNGLMGPLAEYRKHGLIPVLHHVDEVDFVTQSLTQSGPICLKFDTGMGRLGILPNGIDSVLTQLKDSKIELVAVMTHLARADEGVDHTLTAYERFTAIRSAFRAAGFDKTKFSICNSASIIDGHCEDYDWVRPGIAMYGAYPNERQRGLVNLQPVLRLESAILNLKTLRKGAPVGYGGTFICSRDSKIAILPIGYADGYPRLISNRGFVLVRGKRAPIAGRISMDLMAVDVTDVTGVSMYDRVTLIGDDGAESIRVEEVAKWAETISYEILTSLMPRVHREYES